MREDSRIFSGIGGNYRQFIDFSGVACRFDSGVARRASAELALSRVPLNG
jgi:hypothetical protein